MVGLLGSWAARKKLETPPFKPLAGKNQPKQDYFKETGHTLGTGFQLYWYAHNGLKNFGFPISEEFREVSPLDGQNYVVQYFERATFEWHPEAPLEFQIQLAQLGWSYLGQRPAPPEAQAKVKGPQFAWDGVRPTRIVISRLKLDTEIIEGGLSLERWDVPRYTAVHYWPISGFPGTNGNTVIAGHSGYRDTIFNNLLEAVTGDEVVVYNGQTAKKYKITDIWTVEPEDTWVMAPTSKETLTLITCTPLNTFIHRFIVRATPLES